MVMIPSLQIDVPRLFAGRRTAASHAASVRFPRRLTAHPHATRFAARLGHRRGRGRSATESPARPAGSLWRCVAPSSRRLVARLDAVPGERYGAPGKGRYALDPPGSIPGLWPACYRRSPARATGASRMARAALNGVVSGAEVGHRVVNDRASRNGASLAPLEADRRAFEDSADSDISTRTAGAGGTALRGWPQSPRAAWWRTRVSGCSSRPSSASSAGAHPMPLAAARRAFEDAWIRTSRFKPTAARGTARWRMPSGLGDCVASGSRPIRPLLTGVWRPVAGRAVVPSDPRPVVGVSRVIGGSGGRAPSWRRVCRA